MELLPQGSRHRDFESRVDSILPFDNDAPSIYASIRASRQKSGRSVGVQDTMIVIIARSLSAVVATRNAGDFEEGNVEAINPWDYTS